MSTALPAQFGQYTLLKLLARGGMGEIYLARTAGMSNFEKYYAIKKLLKKFAHDRDVGARFIDEAKLGARLQHPNIVQVYDLGAVAEELFMATEFVDGFDLRRVLRYCHEKKKRIPLDVALFIVREILSGLAYAHRQVDADGQSIDLIHRDISPQNVLVSFEGEVKIIDFGLAKSTQRSQETQANVLLGNFGYMSPEQARGHKLDVRTDVYSAGIVLFELTTGTKRFVDDNPLRLLEMVARPTPIMPSDRSPEIPAAINQIYAHATAPPRDDRYKSAELFRDEVTAVLHRINPKAGREHLAQFLNHLFLGGAPPPPVDPDLLDKSIMIQVQELVANSAAFQNPKEGDTADRSLTAFSDDAPQTGSHDGMRAARVGDVMSHIELMGIEPPAEAGFTPPPEADDTSAFASSGDAPANDPDSTFASSADAPVPTDGAIPDLQMTPLPSADTQQASGVHDATGIRAEEAPSEEDVIEIALSDEESAEDDSVIEGEPLSWSDGAVQSKDISGQPTSVYDAPSFLPVEDAVTSPNRKLATEPSSESPELSFHSAYPPQRDEREESEPTPLPANGPIEDWATPQVPTPPSSPPVAATPLPSPPNAPPQQFVATAAPAADPDETEAFSRSEPLVLGRPLAATAESGAVVSTVRNERDYEPEPDEPTMVVNLGSDAPASFGEGAMMESLIIDFDEGGADDGVFDEPPPPMPDIPPLGASLELEEMPAPPPSDPNIRSPRNPPVVEEPPQMTIRPAAQPMGRVSKARTKPMAPPPKKK